MEEAEPEVRQASQGGQGWRTLGLVLCAESQVQTPRVLVLSPGPQE